MIKFFFYFLVAILITKNAYAHPHVWADTRTKLIIENDNLIGVNHHWEFDDFFSLEIIEMIDLNKDKQINEKEAKEAYNTAFISLEDYSYFTHIFSNKQKQKLKTVVDFKPSIQDSNKLIYDFTAYLENPINIKTNKVKFSIYDDSRYIDIKLGDRIAISFSEDVNIDFNIIEDSSNSIWQGMLNPRTIIFK